MVENTFPRVLRGYDMVAVDNLVEELKSEIAEIGKKLGQATDANTELRLSVGRQIEEASAEAAVVLGHSRSEATRIREAASTQSATIISDAKLVADGLLKKATEANDEALELKDSTQAAAKEIIAQAGERSNTIVASAQERAEKLEDEAKKVLAEAVKRAQDIDSELRAQKTQLDRQEAEVRDQADSYALRVYREADQYAKTTEQRALDLEKQAEEIVLQAKRAAHDTTSRALSNARKNVEESLGLVNTIFSDVSGSLTDVARIRRVLSDQVERLSAREPIAQEVTDVSGPRATVSPGITEPDKDDEAPTF
jgi:cell division septum initiation protein DivIVA